jgi:phage terminase large subunit-like protein
MVRRLRVDGVPEGEFRATTQNFSLAIVELDAAMRAVRLRHDGNPVLEWCLGNVVGKAGRCSIYPTKGRPDQKIGDGPPMVEDDRAKGLAGFRPTRFFDFQ